MAQDSGVRWDRKANPIGMRATTKVSMADTAGFDSDEDLMRSGVLNHHVLDLPLPTPILWGATDNCSC